MAVVVVVVVVLCVWWNTPFMNIRHTTFFLNCFKSYYLIIQGKKFNKIYIWHEKQLNYDYAPYSNNKTENTSPFTLLTPLITFVHSLIRPLSFFMSKSIFKGSVSEHSSAFCEVEADFDFCLRLLILLFLLWASSFSGGGLWNNKNVFYPPAVSPTTFVSHLTDFGTGILGRENDGCMMVQK